MTVFSKKVSNLKLSANFALKLDYKNIFSVSFKKIPTQKAADNQKNLLDTALNHKNSIHFQTDKL